MSGPKCYDYSVAEDPAVVAARAEARALAAERARVTAALARLAALQTDAAALAAAYAGRITKVEIPAVADAATSGETAVIAEALTRAAAAAEARLTSEAGAARVDSILTRLRGDSPEATAPGLARFLAAAADLAAPETAATVSAATDARETFADECARIFARLRPDVSPESADRVRETLEVALAATGSERAPLIADRLRNAVAEANAAAYEAEARRAAVDVLLESLGTLGADDAASLRELLVAERGRGRPLQELRQLVETRRRAAEAREAEERRAERRAKVAAALEEAFADLGYDVQGGFETALTTDGSAFVRRQGWDEHAVRLLLDPRTDRLRMHVVRDDAPGDSRAEDAEHEFELCADRPALEHALARRGVELEARELRPAGTVPVAALPLGDVEFAGRRRRERPIERRR